jgi:xanthine dehydrogenase accessory factor
MTRETVLRYDDGDPDGWHELVLVSVLPPPRLILFGAADAARPLSRMGKSLGRHVTLCDAIALRASPEFYPEADEIVIMPPAALLDTLEVRPDTGVCVLAADEAWSVPTIKSALASRAGYVGVMDLHTAPAGLLQRLEEAGVPVDQLQRLRTPLSPAAVPCTPEEAGALLIADLKTVLNVVPHPDVASH